MNTYTVNLALTLRRRVSVHTGLHVNLNCVAKLLMIKIAKAWVSMLSEQIYYVHVRGPPILGGKVGYSDYLDSLCIPQK